MNKKVACLTTAALLLDCGNGNELEQYDCGELLTTPQPDFLHQFFGLCVKKNIEYVVVEVAVQAHTFFRLEHVFFDGIIFTNIDQEHGELYNSFEDYFQEKQKIFSHAKPNCSIIVNEDEPHIKQLKNNFNNNVLGYSIEKKTDYYGQLLLNQLSEQKIVLHSYNNDPIKIAYDHFPGNYNASNITAAYGVVAEVTKNYNSLDNQKITISPLPGRFELLEMRNGAQVCIDYAHTAESFKALLSFAQTISAHIIVVFGAGGEKDMIKRPLMGKFAAHYADLVIITDDNPRFEDAKKIVVDILAGVEQKDAHKVIIEQDRRKAIEIAYQMSKKNSLIMLLGKGPDTVQIIKNERLYFNEKEILSSLQTS